MSKLKQLIALQRTNLSVRALARALDLSVGPVSTYLRAMKAAEIDAAEAQMLTDIDLEQRVLGRLSRAGRRNWCRRTAPGSMQTSSVTGM